MNDTHCPICYTPLEVRDVAPCMDCGALPNEIEHALSGRHTYAEYRIFGDLTLVLCDFHQVDFGSYDPAYFGLPKNTRIGFQKMQYVRSVEEIRITKDKYCPECDRRLAFLKFLEQARQLNTSTASKSAEGTPHDR
jgi:hypothetical protein